MSPRHFAKMYQNHKPSQHEIEFEEKIESVVKHVIAVIAVPIKKIMGK